MEGGVKPANRFMFKGIYMDKILEIIPNNGPVDNVRQVKVRSLCDNTTELEKTVMPGESSDSIRPELPPRPKVLPGILDIIRVYAPPHSGPSRLDGNRTKSTSRQISPVEQPSMQPPGEIIAPGIQDPSQALDPLQTPYAPPAGPGAFAQKWSEIIEAVSDGSYT